MNPSDTDPRIFLETAWNIGMPELTGSVVDTSPPAPWDLYTPDLGSLIERYRVLTTPTTALAILDLVAA